MHLFSLSYYQFLLKHLEKLIKGSISFLTTRTKNAMLHFFILIFHSTKNAIYSATVSFNRPDTLLPRPLIPYSFDKVAWPFNAPSAYFKASAQGLRGPGPAAR